MLDSVRDWLRIDYRVITFQRGAEALEYLRSGQVADVILSDQRMPEMTGVEVLRQAKAIRPETTRLLFTAYIDIRTVIDAINQGHVFRYIAKPCDPDELAVVVRQAVEHHNLIVEKNRLLAELKESNARLLEANRLKGAFIEVASHELNTPVTVMLGMIELWKMSQGQMPRRWSASGSIGSVPRPDGWRGRSRRCSSWYEIGSSASRSMRNRSSSSRSCGRRSTICPPISSARPGGVGVDRAGPGSARSRPVQDLRRAHQPVGQRGQVHAGRWHDPAGSPGRAADRDWIRVSVRDQGAGVSAADQQHLFEPFFTGFDTLRHSSGDYQFGKRGIGLGLWLVKTFVELHGGRVEVSSTPGAGLDLLVPAAAITGRGVEHDVRSGRDLARW